LSKHMGWFRSKRVREIADQKRRQRRTPSCSTNGGESRGGVEERGLLTNTPKWVPSNGTLRGCAVQSKGKGTSVDEGAIGQKK